LQIMNKKVSLLAISYQTRILWSLKKVWLMFHRFEISAKKKEYGGKHILFDIYAIEKFMGCRFYRPDDAQLPLRSIKTISELGSQKKNKKNVGFGNFLALGMTSHIVCVRVWFGVGWIPIVNYFGDSVEQQNASIIFFSIPFRIWFSPSPWLNGDGNSLQDYSYIFFITHLLPPFPLTLRNCRGGVACAVDGKVFPVTTQLNQDELKWELDFCAKYSHSPAIC
jgi:hypothetical protein